MNRASTRANFSTSVVPAAPPSTWATACQLWPSTDVGHDIVGRPQRHRWTGRRCLVGNRRLRPLLAPLEGHAAHGSRTVRHRRGECRWDRLRLPVRCRAPVDRGQCGRTRLRRRSRGSPAPHDIGGTGQVRPPGWHGERLTRGDLMRAGSGGHRQGRTAGHGDRRRLLADRDGEPSTVPRHVAENDTPQAGWSDWGTAAPHWRSSASRSTRRGTPGGSRRCRS